MDVQIRDSAALRRISPAQLSSYLKVHGWTHDETWRSRVSVWSKERDGRVRQILAPLMEVSDTYAVRVSEAVSTLAEMENRSQLEVYRDAIEAGADTIRLRSLNGNGSDRRSLNESVEFLSNARELVFAAARGAERPGLPVYRGRPSGTVAQYMARVHPLPGYEAGDDLILHSRVPPDYGDQADLGDTFHEPFARSATLALSRSLREAGETVQTVLGGAALSSFGQAAQRGVSANMCDAVAALASGQHGIGISISWAAVRPSTASIEDFAFAEGSADVLADGANLLRRNSPFLDARVIGEIVRLDRDSQEEFDGRAVMLYELDGRSVALHVQFRAEDREEVLRAFRDGIEVSLDGDVHRDGRQYRLKNPRNFSVAATLG